LIRCRRIAFVESPTPRDHRSAAEVNPFEQ
ncbi:MAG: hypothetical protein ACI9D1_000709, partial [Cryomorphaceae bacterium]